MDNVDLLRELVRVDTTNPPGNEAPAAELLSESLGAAGAETHIQMAGDGRPTLIARVAGPTDVPALVLVSHTDVVPVEEDSWTHDPFGGEVADGYMWGRGTLDMKGIAVMHAAALRALTTSGATPRREVILVSFADEEAGGTNGAEAVLRDVPERLGFGDDRPPPIALGEGAFGLADVVERPLMPIVVGEKSALWLELTATGDPGHGALPPARQATVNLARAVAKISGFRAPRVHPVMRRQFEILAEQADPPRSAIFRALGSAAGSQVGRVLQKPLRKKGAIAALLSDTVTPTQVHAGYKQNVVPGEATASFDCRLLPDTDIDGLVASLGKTCSRYDVRVREVARHAGPVSQGGELFDEISRSSSVMEERPIVVPSLTSGMTDLRFFRARGATAYGWVPLVLDSELLSTIHGHDERVPLDAFARAVDVFKDVVMRTSVAT